MRSSEMKIRKGSRSKIPFLLTLIVSVAFTFGFAHQAVAARLIDESFEANPGYDESWNETVGTGCTLYEDAAIPVTAPPSAGSQCLQSISASTGYKAFAVRNLGDYFSTTYTRVYIYIDSYNSTAIKDIFRTQYMNGSSAERVWRLMVDDNGTTLKFQILTGSTSPTYSASITIRKWYRVEVQYDIPGNA
jgi:hypothetical protein